MTGDFYFILLFLTLQLKLKIRKKLVGVVRSLKLKAGLINNVISNNYVEKEESASFFLVVASLLHKI